MVREYHLGPATDVEAAVVNEEATRTMGDDEAAVVFSEETVMLSEEATRRVGDIEAVVLTEEMEEDGEQRRISYGTGVCFLQEFCDLMDEE